MVFNHFSNSRLHVREICTEADFLHLREPWGRLVASVGGTVFQHHEWLTAAWAWCRQTAQTPWIICVFDNDRLVGALPLLRPTASTGDGRQLTFMCIPDTQWCDVLLCPNASPAVSRLLAKRLVETASSWDVLRLEKLPEEAAVSGWLALALGAFGVAVHLEAVDCNLSVDLEAPWPAYCNRLSRSLKKSRNLAANRLERAGAVQVEWVTAETLARDGLQPLLDEAVSISAHSWKRDTGKTLERPAPQAFIRALTDVAFAKRWLSIWFLRIDGRPVAMEYQLMADGLVYALRADFDERFAHLSPGTYLNFHMLERMFAEQGLRRYSMGPGANPYKNRWSHGSDTVYTLTGFAPTVRGRAGNLWFEIKPKLKNWKNRFTS